MKLLISCSTPYLSKDEILALPEYKQLKALESRITKLEEQRVLLCQKMGARTARIAKELIREGR